jgi:hypothetical protein
MENTNNFLLRFFKFWEQKELEIFWGLGNEV